MSGGRSSARATRRCARPTSTFRSTARTDRCSSPGLENSGFRNGNAGPDVVFYVPRALILDRRDEVLGVDAEEPQAHGLASAQFRRRLEPQSQRLEAVSYFRHRGTGTRTRPGSPPGSQPRGPDARRNYELGGDYEFGLGGGRLKLIGLHRVTHTPYPTDPGADLRRRDPDLRRSLHARMATRRESIAPRRISLEQRRRRLAGQPEGALNRLDVENGLFDLNRRAVSTTSRSRERRHASRSTAPKRSAATAGRSRPNLTLQPRSATNIRNWRR